jgi:hypothetical protein
MKAEDEIIVTVEGEPYSVEAYPEEDDVDGQPVEGADGVGAAADAAAAPLKGMKNHMDAMDGYTLLVLLLISSIVVFVAGCVECFDASNIIGPNGYSWWAFSGSLISIIACIVLIVLKKCAEDASITAGPYIMIFLLVLWICIVMPLTFVQPFTTFGNGWVGTWLSVFVAGALAARAFADKAKAVTTVIESQNGNEATKFALLLGMGSLIVMIASSVVYSTGGGCVLDVSYTAYCISVSVISIVACVIILVVANVASIKEHSGKVNMALSIFLIVWWILGAFFATFKAPFKNTCNMNGYAGTWISLFAAVSLFKACGLDTVKQIISKVKGNNNEGNKDNSDETPAL